MNTFYERLTRFGLLIDDANQRTGEHLEELFTVVHPGHPVVTHTRSTTPMLIFEQTCPIPVRRKVRQLMRKAFSGRNKG